MPQAKPRDPELQKHQAGLMQQTPGTSSPSTSPLAPQRVTGPVAPLGLAAAAKKLLLRLAGKRHYIEDSAPSGVLVETLIVCASHLKAGGEIP